EDAARLSFSDGSFDMLCSVNVMHHLTDPLKVAAEMLRVVSKKGKIVISDFSKEGFKMIEEFHASEGRSHERSKVTMDDIALFFKQNGLDVSLANSRFQDVLTASFKI
ncbi:MAG: methyltransferase domain-containing protein, partial [Candidatus Omnitrophota bacterium]